MSDILITEAGDTLVMETVAGISGASNLNDISIVTIFTDDFTTNPVNNGWNIGTDWQWDIANNRLEII